MSEPFDAEAIFRVLNQHHVQYVVIGGYAALLHGGTKPTVDVDVTPATDTQNLTNLTAALVHLQARIRVDGIHGGLPFATDANALAGMTALNLVTAYGELDLSLSPSGTQGYPDLIRAAAPHQVGNLAVQVASLRDVIRSKTAAGRPKDFDALPELITIANRQRPHDQVQNFRGD
ncbi:hypothetical protein EH165_12375 [Nakamurella antarctica]|uniref:Nucleotidyl transferase AbiEii toxin, Type IV TA system n=1 Tax=Nakamurella antarctica TaxID=1902245 RepID=A0A3G8ZNJ1_9ACTN|nr:DUF6036 family nucleotidyltransferase [Nakamurella antarctica]AZI58813.1 hypothetical protein EH165_12375 [Nakamurella antarctica]